MAKLGFQFTYFLVIFALGLIHFPNQAESGKEPEKTEPEPIQFHRGSCLGVEHEETPYNKKTGGYRRTIGSGLFKKVNPDVWKNYTDLQRSQTASGNTGNWFAFQEEGLKIEPLQVELYGIKVDGRFLNGWLHVVLKHAGPAVRNFEILQIHGMVDYFINLNPSGNSDYGSTESGRGGFGDFVHDFPSCTDAEHKDDLKPTKYQFMPCGGLPERGQTMPWGFEYVHLEEGTDSDLVPSGKHREFHMNFRFSTQPCNHPKVVRFALIAYLDGGTDLDEIDHQNYYKPDHRWRFGVSDEIILDDYLVVGAADPVPRPGTYSTLDCSTRMNRDSASKVKYVADVFLRANTTRWQRLFQFGCTEAETKELFGKNDPGETALFGGRCKKDDKNSFSIYWDSDRASTTRINICHPNTVIKDPSTEITAVEYNKHVANITDNIASLCAPCPTVPPRPLTTQRTKPTIRYSSTSPRPSGPKDDFTIEELAELKRGVEMTGSMTLGIWDTRLLHGVCMTILSIFVSPINIFITRYFKETFMDTRIMFLRLWYFVHHSAIVASAILYGAGLWRVVSRRVLAGVSLSLSATVHRSLGWTSIGIVILLALFGGFRPIERKLRTYVIAAHWTLGMTIYFMNYTLMINSVWIPSSPSALVESSDDSFQIGKLVVPFFVISWIVFDVAMHVLMTIHVCSMDKRLGLTRPRYWLPVPISVLPEDETRDLIGSSRRKKMLVVYGVVALVFTVAISCVLLASNPNGRGLGLMSCTHTGRGKYWEVMGKKRC